MPARIQLARSIGISMFIISGCASVPTTDLTTLLQPDPRLPRKEHIELIGAPLAIQQVVALGPQAAQTLAAYDLNTATATIVTLLFRNPPEQLAANAVTFKIPVYALAHTEFRTSSGRRTGGGVGRFGLRSRHCRRSRR